MKKTFYTPNRNEELAASMGFTITRDGLVIQSADGKVLKQSVNKCGHHVFSFGPKKKRKKCFVHRFNAYMNGHGIAIYEPNIVCRHLDGNPSNNHINNIALGSQSDNMMDRPAAERRAHAFATSRFAMKHDHAAIIEFYKTHGFNKTMVEFGISSKGTLSFIINRTRTAQPVPKDQRPKKVAQSNPLDLIAKSP